MAAYSLAGQIAVVTGASSGIGRAIALELASAGAACFVHARRSREPLEQLVEQINQQGGTATSWLCDLAEPSTHEPLVDAAWEWRGRVDIWVNNAGADVLTGGVWSWSFERKLELLWAVDVRAAIHLSRLAGRRMKQRGQGTVINIGWDQAEQGMAGDSGELFSATKGAVMAFSRSLAQSLAPEVRVNCVAPGWIKTAWGHGASDEWQQRARRESLRNRWGTPEDIARAVRFLASSESEFINGHILPVNGGFRFGCP